MSCKQDAEHYIIYTLINKLNQKSYIGQTSRELKIRLQEHQSPKSGCIKLRNALQKYGIFNFEIEILSTTDNLSTANFLEKFYINIYDSINNGYNLKEGGSNGKPSEETRKIWSRQRSGKNNPMYGKHHTQSVKNTISEKMKGKDGYWLNKPLSTETKNKISISRKGLTSGENNPGSKLKFNEVEEIKFLLQNSTLTQKQIAANYNVSLSSIKRIRAGTHWK